MYVRIGRYRDDDIPREEHVVIHNYDTWSMDHTLALIITPMLKQLKETKHGAPAVEAKDVPEELWVPRDQIEGTYHGETDDNYFKRWDYVLDEMIWAFEQKANDDTWQDEYYGPYIKNPDGGLGSFEWVDYDGLKAHGERMKNGFRLFGKYYEGLWD